MGAMIWHSVVNVDPENGRPCALILLEHARTGWRTLLLNVHFPWITSDAHLRAVERTLTHSLPRMHVDQVLLGGDTNDGDTRLHAGRPLRLGSWRLSHGLTREAARRNLVTCCWHEHGHEYASFDATGDYVLASIPVRRIGVPRPYRETSAALHSDHLPVLATVAM